MIWAFLSKWLSYALKNLHTNGAKMCTTNSIWRSQNAHISHAKARMEKNFHLESTTTRASYQLWKRRSQTLQMFWIKYGKIQERTLWKILVRNWKRSKGSKERVRHKNQQLLRSWMQVDKSRGFLALQKNQRQWFVSIVKNEACDVCEECEQLVSTI